ncbi:MAG: hypothetical protein JW723_07445 [Bacteroidales bacterium]|nr:hypothetical protein [Bacteroidales bacterium]
MKKFLLSLLVLSVCLFVSAQSERKVRATEIVAKEIWNHTNSKSIFLEGIDRFDEEGNLIEEIKYNPDGSIRKHFKYTFNENNDILTEIEYDASGRVIYKTEHVYEGLLKISKKEFNEKGKLVSSKVYKYKFSK